MKEYSYETSTLYLHEKFKQWQDVDTFIDYSSLNKPDLSAFFSRDPVVQAASRQFVLTSPVIDLSSRSIDKGAFYDFSNNSYIVFKNCDPALTLEYTGPINEKELEIIVRQQFCVGCS